MPDIKTPNNARLQPIQHSNSLIALLAMRQQPHADMSHAMPGGRATPYHSPQLVQ
jgi:hypothetical protein